MKYFRLFPIAVVFLVMVLVGQASAATFTNPFPTVVNDDDGSSIFRHDAVTLHVELADILDPTGGFFGFYFAGSDVTSLANLHPLFAPGDAAGSMRTINFTLGQIFDLPSGTIKGTFSGSGDIGFFFGNGVDPFFFTDQVLNPLGLDLAGTFPFISNPTAYLVEFAIPSGLAGNPSDIQLSLHIAGGIVPVPEPETYALMLAGLGLLGFAARRRKQKEAAAA